MLCGSPQGRLEVDGRETHEVFQLPGHRLFVSFGSHQVQVEISSHHCVIGQSLVVELLSVQVDERGQVLQQSIFRNNNLACSVQADVSDELR
jgi:hypothetical protein